MLCYVSGVSLCDKYYTKTGEKVWINAHLKKYYTVFSDIHVVIETRIIN